MEILGLIPARGGSRGIPGKNLAPLLGRPLLAYTAAAATASATLTRCILSTDDERIAAAGRELGVEVPFLRPAELALDDTPAFPVVAHAVEWVAAEGRPADVVVLLQPTSPLRRAEHVDAAVRLLLETGAESVVSVVPVPHRFAPASLLRLGAGGRVEPALPAAGGAGDPLLRQQKEQLVARNGPAVYVARVEELLLRGSLYGAETVAYPMSPLDSVDADDLDDLALCEALLAARAGCA